MGEHGVNVSARVGVVLEADCAERAQVRHDAHVLAWLEMPSPAMSAFFLSERGDASPDFESAFLEATEVSEIEQEIEVRQGFRKTAKSSAERDAAEKSIAALEKRREPLLWPQIGIHQGNEIAAVAPVKVSVDVEPVSAITASTSGDVELMPAGEPKGNVATSPVFSMSRAALVKAHSHHWPTIVGDLKDANKNGLAAAKAGARDWTESLALLWARSKGKLTAEDASGTTQAMHRMVSLPSRTHTQKV